MAQDKRQVDAITARDVDFAQWYTDVCKKAELIDYTSVKGMFIYRLRLRPVGEYPGGAGPALQGHGARERVPASADPGVPAPEGEGPCGGLCTECAWVTVGGSEKLEDRCAIRPTSETLFCEHYANIIHSWRDLPKLYNQCAACCGGKRPPAPSCAIGNSCGRRATPCTPPPKRPGKRPCRC